MLHQCEEIDLISGNRSRDADDLALDILDARERSFETTMSYC